MHEFHEELVVLLKQGGIYSFFNGLCADNQCAFPLCFLCLTSRFFYDVYCRVAEMELTSLGFQVTWEEIELGPDALAPDTWDGINGQYWQLKTYRLPTCRYIKPPL